MDNGTLFRFFTDETEFRRQLRTSREENSNK